MIGIKACTRFLKLHNDTILAILTMLRLHFDLKNLKNI